MRNRLSSALRELYALKPKWQLASRLVALANCHLNTVAPLNNG